jgi:hypothetical protein
MLSLKRVATLLLLGLGMPAFLQATTLTRMSTEQLAAQSSNIVIGTCTKLRSAWVNRTLVTLATISVAESLKGDAAAELTLVVPGGVDASRAVPVAVIYPDAPFVGLADNVLLFLDGNSMVADSYAIVGYSQGKYSIVSDASGNAVARNSASSGTVDLGSLKQQIRDAVDAQEGNQP